MLETSKLIGAGFATIVVQDPGLELQAIKIIYIIGGLLLIILAIAAALLAIPGNQDVVYHSEQAVQDQITSDTILNPDKFTLTFKLNTHMTINENRNPPFALREVPQHLPVALTNEDDSTIKHILSYNPTLRLTHEVNPTDGIIYDRITGTKACANFNLLKAVYIYERSKP